MTSSSLRNILFSCILAAAALPTAAQQSASYRIMNVAEPIADQYVVRIADDSADLAAVAETLKGTYGVQIIQAFGRSQAALLVSGSRQVMEQVTRDDRFRYVAEYDGGAISGGTRNTFTLDSVDAGLRTLYLADSIVQGAFVRGTRPLATLAAGSKPGATPREVQDRIARAHLFGRSMGFASATPNFHCADYPDQDAPGWMRRKCGTIMLSSIAAEYRMVAASDLGNPTPGDVGAMLRAANDYAAARQYRGAYPTFQTAYDPPASGGRVSYGVVLLLADGVVWKDVPRASLGTAAFDDWGQRFRDVYTYATKNGYVGGQPNGHQANYGAGVVYGTYLYRATGAFWWDVPGVVYGEPDYFTGAAASTSSVPVSLRRHHLPLWSCGPNEDTSVLCGASVDPAWRGGDSLRSKIVRVTNLTGFRVDITYTDPHQVAVSQSGVNNGSAVASPFAPLELGGWFQAKLAQSASELAPDQTVTLEVEYATPGSALTSGPTPYPVAPSPPTPLLYYRIASVSAEGKGMDVNANACASAQLILWPAHINSDNQLVQFVPYPDGSQYIRVKSSGLVFDVEGGDHPAPSGTRVQQYSRIEGARNQRFWVRAAGDGAYRITPLSSPEKALSIEGASVQGGARIVVTDWDTFRSNNDQRWRLEPTNIVTFLNTPYTCW